MARIEAVRVAQDAAYAASLSDAEWYALSQDHDWQQLVAEQSEMVGGVLAVYGDKFPGYGAATGAIPDAGSAQSAAFKVAGTDVGRMQGLGIVTNLGQYTENIRTTGIRFTRTRSS